MAITITYKSSVYATTNTAASFTAAPTWTPAANSLVLAFVCTTYTTAPSDPTGVTGHGLTYSKLTLGTSTLSTTHKLSAWVAKAGATPTSAACVAATTTTNGTGALIIEFEITGADVSGTALAAIVASSATNTGTGTSHTVTLAAAGSSDNRALVFDVQLSNAAPAAAGSWTLTAGAAGNFNTPATGAAALFRNNAFDTAGAATGANVAWRMVGVEIKAAKEITAEKGTYAVTGAAATEFLGDVTWSTVVSGLSAVATSASDTTASASTTYLYRVVAELAGGDDTPSNRDQVTTPAPAGGGDLTATPGTLTGTGVAASLALALVASAGGYAITGAAAGTTAPPLTASATSYAITGRLTTELGPQSLTASVGSYSTTGRAVSTAGSVAVLPGTYTGAGAVATMTDATMLVVELRQGATLIATRTLSPTATATTFLASLTAPERALITDWTALRLAFIATGQTVRVSWAALRTPAADLALVAAPAVYGLTGSAAGLSAGFATTASPHVYALTGVVLAPTAALLETLLAGNGTITGAAATVVGSISVTATAAPYIVTPVDVVDVHAGTSQATFVTAANAATNSATTISVVIPAPATEGDLAVVVVGHRGGNTGTLSAVTAGWAAISTQQNAGPTTLATRLFSKLLTAGDIGTAHTFAFNTPAAVKGAIVAVVTRGSGIALVTSANQTNNQAPSIAVPGISFAPQGVLLFAIGHKANDQEHLAVSGWTLDPLATSASAGGNLASRNRLSAQYRTFQGQAPGGVTILAGGSGAFTTGHQFAVAAGAAMSASPASYDAEGLDATLFAETAILELAGAYATAGSTTVTAIGSPLTAGSYGTTGAAATFAQAHALTASAGSYTASGAVAGLEVLGIYALAADRGAYAATGRSATLAALFPVAAFPGTYSSTGRSTTAALAAPLPAGALSLTGRDVSLVPVYAVAALRATLTVTGRAAVLALATRLDPATLTLTERDASVLAGGAVAAIRGGYTLAGLAAGLEIAGAFLLDAEPAAYTATGATASLPTAALFTASPSSYSWTGRLSTDALAVPVLRGPYAATGTAATTSAPPLTASAGSHLTTGRPASVVASRVTPALASPYTLAGANSGEQVTRALIAASGAYSAIGQDADLQRVGAETITAERGTVTLTGAAATLVATTAPLTATSTAYSLTGRPATFPAAGLEVTAERGTHTLTGAAATLFLTAAPLTADPGTYTGTGAPSAATFPLTAMRGAYVLTGAPLTVLLAPVVDCAPGAYAITGADCTLEVSSAPHLDIGFTSVVSTTPTRTVETLTPTRSVVTLTAIHTVEEVSS